MRSLTKILKFGILTLHFSFASLCFCKCCIIICGSVSCNVVILMSDQERRQVKNLNYMFHVVMETLGLT